MTFEKGKNALTVSNISESLKRKRLRDNTVFIFKPNEGGFYLRGKRIIPEATFNYIYPPIKMKKTSYKGENSDKRKNWMNDEKSY